MMFTKRIRCVGSRLVLWLTLLSGTSLALAQEMSEEREGQRGPLVVPSREEETSALEAPQTVEIRPVATDQEIAARLAAILRATSPPVSDGAGNCPGRSGPILYHPGSNLAGTFPRGTYPRPNCPESRGVFLMRSLFVMLVLFAFSTGLGVTVTAADTSDPVNPFSQPSPSNRSVSASVSDDSEDNERSGFALPKLSLPKPALPRIKMPKLQMPKLSMPGWTKREPSPRAGPTTWQKLNNGTRRMFAKTRDTLMPWAVKDDSPPVRHATGSQNSTGFSRTRVASNRNSGESTGEKKSLFSSFLPSSEPAEKPIRTTNDFLSQERPDFN